MFGRLHELADNLRHHARSRKDRPDDAAGRRGEDIAHRYLQRAGVVIVARNYRTSSGSGELDLVGWDGETLVFVEVKSRHSEAYGAPERNIGEEKQRALVRAAREYARHAEVPFECVRFDVVAIVLGTPPQVRHYRDVFCARWDR